MSDSDGELERPCFGQVTSFIGEKGSTEHIFGSLSDSTSGEEFGDFSDQPPHKKMKFTVVNTTSEKAEESEDLSGRKLQLKMVKTTNEKAEELIISSHPKKDEPLYSLQSANMMAKMGYTEGRGLGKHGQGRTEIVEASKQRGRRGLGHFVTGFEPEDAEWSTEMDEFSAEEMVEWMPVCDSPVPDLDTMRRWIKMGKKSSIREDETEFCDITVLNNVLECKSVFDNLENEEMRRARTKSNPFETIRGAIFQNRAAMKMANMDAVLDFMFTNPKDEEGRLILGPHDLLYFADICAGPGGFSEYVLWRKKCSAKGFGFTLKGACDFKLEEFFAAPSELFEPHYGVGGIDGDGDIYKPNNLIAFRKFVMENTDDNGVHFVMADGGFSVEGKENLQEILSRRLYLCQFLCALSILRTGGHFVCKLFDIFTTFSVGLVYLMYHVFKEVSIFKPVTSRPANSERYIICKHLKEDSQSVHDYLFEVNMELDKISILSEEDVVEVVPLNVLLADKPFYDYIVSSNEKLGDKQVLNLKKIQTFAKNIDLHELRQAEMRELCLKKWEVPDSTRTAPVKEEPGQKMGHLMGDESIHILSKEPAELDPTQLHSIKSAYDYRVMVLASTERCFILSLGRSHIYKYDGQSRWKKLETTADGKMTVKLELPRDTLLEVEFVQEHKGEGRGQKRVLSVHVIDGITLYGEDLQVHHFNERIEYLKKFAKAVNKSSRADLAPLCVKDIFKLEEIQEIRSRLQHKVVKGMGFMPRECYCSSSGRTYLPTGLLLYKTVREPWTMAWSKSNNRKYFYNRMTRQSMFEIPKESIASYKECRSSRLLWRWPSEEKQSSGVGWNELSDYVKSIR